MNIIYPFAGILCDPEYVYDVIRLFLWSSPTIFAPHTDRTHQSITSTATISTATNDTVSTQIVFDADQCARTLTNTCYP